MFLLKSSCIFNNILDFPEIKNIIMEKPTETTSYHARNAVHNKNTSNLPYLRHNFHHTTHLLAVHFLS